MPFASAPLGTFLLRRRALDPRLRARPGGRHSKPSWPAANRIVSSNARAGVTSGSSRAIGTARASQSRWPLRAAGKPHRWARPGMSVSRPCSWPP